MENPYVIRKEKNLYYVLPEDSLKSVLSEETLKSTLIIINLYYLDSLDKYLRYLDIIPAQIQVYIVSSSERLLEQVRIYIESKELINVELVIKKNRGRDISALLVSCREEILKYKYLCFVHDKKASQEYLKNDTDMWIDNLWDNTLISAKYISNVINLFENNCKIGLLVPPEPIGEHMMHWFSNTWGGNYENTQGLADKLKIGCCMDSDIPVITLGTVFWCKIDALLKLFQVKWKYEDFPDEPLPMDGTLSHAIERILSFVAQDAGYYTGTIMCSSYARRLMSFLQDNMRKAFNVLSYFTLKNEYDICKINVTEAGISKLIKFCNENDAIYLYGAGVIGNRCLNFLRMNGCEPKGFIVSEKVYNAEINGLKVINLWQLKSIKKVGIIVTVSEKYQKEVIANLIDYDFDNYISYFDT